MYLSVKFNFNKSDFSFSNSSISCTKFLIHQCGKGFTENETSSVKYKQEFKISSGFFQGIDGIAFKKKTNAFWSVGDKRGC